MRVRRPRWLRSAVMIFPVMLASCADDAAGPKGVVDAELHIVSGGAVTDTIEAAPATPLVVELRTANGRPVKGVEIRFETLPGDGVPARDISRLGLTRGGAAPLFTEHIDTTDAQGRATTYVHFGRVAASVAVRVSAPEVGAATTTPYEVRPGAVTSVTATPSDTALYRGSSYRVTAVGRDRRGNVTPDVPTLGTIGAITVTPDGQVTTSVIERGGIVAAFGAQSDTAYVSVLPAATIVAGMTHDVFAPVRASLLQVELDGSNPRFLTTFEGSVMREMNPAWGPLGDRLVFVGPYHEGNVFVIDAEGRERRLLPQPYTVGSVTWPRYSRDGEWTYFAANPIPYPVHVLWRARPDGTGLEQLTQSVGSDIYEYPSPSHDGTRLAYSGWKPTFGGLPSLRILDIATRTSTDLGIPNAYCPVWSPIDDRIAYLEITLDNTTRLHVVRADGSNDRVVAEGAFQSGIDWSPDGKWLIVRRNNVLTVIDSETGLLLPIAYFNQLFQPSWRP